MMFERVSKRKIPRVLDYLSEVRRKNCSKPKQE